MDKDIEILVKAMPFTNTKSEAMVAANVQFDDGAAFSGYAKEAIRVLTVYRLMTQILDQAA